MIESSTNQHGIQLIKFNNPNVKNALSIDDYKEVTRLLVHAATSDQVKLTVLTGEGEFYSSGNNLKTPVNAHEMVNAMKEMIAAMIEYPKLLIGLVNGPCFGIAATTVALCDVIYAAESAYFYTPFSRWAVSVEGCASYTFPRILGRSKANEMLLLNHKMTTKEAKEFNFVSRVYNDGELAGIRKQIEGYAELSTCSIITSKKLMKMDEIEKLKLVNEKESEEFLKSFTSEEAQNAFKDFIRK